MPKDLGEFPIGRIYLRVGAGLFLGVTLQLRNLKLDGIILNDSIQPGRRLSARHERFFDVNKLPFDYVDREVEKLYDKKLDGSLDDHISFIAAFINACGWTEDEYQDVKHRIPEKYLNPKLN